MKRSKGIQFFTFKEGKSVKILEGVENIEISFYGYDLRTREHRWSNDFEGRKMKLLPSVVTISYKRQGKREKQIFGSYVNSSLKMGYNEIYQNK